MIYICAFGMLNALGNSADEIARNMQCNETPGMKRLTGWLQHGVSAVFGRVMGELPPVPPQFACHRSRNNQLLLAALQQIRPAVEQAIDRAGRQRLAVILGTSTSGLDEADRFISGSLKGQGEQSGYHYYQQELGDPSRFLAAYLRLSGPAFTLSTACSSSARAIISAARLIQAGIVDAALAGGADSLSRMPVNGFNSLESLSRERCQPFARDRCGITIGEAAGLVLLTRQPQPLALLGMGESSDAWHISAPHPQGAGAMLAMRQALANAGLSAGQLGYINLHGTATRLNDQIEASVVHQLCGNSVPCSSTKHLTGHTLGAAGITEALLCALILQRNLALPAQDFSLSPYDSRLPDCGILSASATLSQPLIMTNSFAFGGNNTSLILGRQP